MSRSSMRWLRPFEEPGALAVFHSVRGSGERFGTAGSEGVSLIGARISEALRRDRLFHRGSAAPLPSLGGRERWGPFVIVVQLVRASRYSLPSSSNPACPSPPHIFSGWTVVASCGVHNAIELRIDVGRFADVCSPAGQ